MNKFACAAPHSCRPREFEVADGFQVPQATNMGFSKAAGVAARLGEGPGKPATLRLPGTDSLRMFGGWKQLAEILAMVGQPILSPVDVPPQATVFVALPQPLAGQVAERLARLERGLHVVLP